MDFFQLPKLIKQRLKENIEDLLNESTETVGCYEMLAIFEGQLLEDKGYDMTPYYNCINDAYIVRESKITGVKESAYINRANINTGRTME